MKISKSKQELARIISENGGWRDGAEFAAQDKYGEVFFYYTRPTKRKESEVWHHSGVLGGDWIECERAMPNWHQTILSRAEYFHLYPASDADGWIEWKGGECPVDGDSIIDLKLSDGDEFLGVDADWDWQHGYGCNIVAYRLHKTEQAEHEFCESMMGSIPEPEVKPTIEQLAADYLNAKDYAERKQQEVDAAKADAEARLKALEIAAEDLGFKIEPITTKQDGL